MTLILTLTDVSSEKPHISAVNCVKTIRVDRRDALIGSRSGCDLIVKDLCVSSRHAKITYRDGGYWLSELGTNGVCVNFSTTCIGRNNEYQIRPGDTIEIGRTFVFAQVDGAPQGLSELTMRLQEHCRRMPKAIATARYEKVTHAEPFVVAAMDLNGRPLPRFGAFDLYKLEISVVFHPSLEMPQIWGARANRAEWHMPRLVGSIRIVGYSRRADGINAFVKWEGPPIGLHDTLRLRLSRSRSAASPKDVSAMDGAVPRETRRKRWQRLIEKVDSLGTADDKARMHAICKLPIEGASKSAGPLLMDQRVAIMRVSINGEAPVVAGGERLDSVAYRLVVTGALGPESDFCFDSTDDLLIDSGVTGTSENYWTVWDRRHFRSPDFKDVRLCFFPEQHPSLPATIEQTNMGPLTCGGSFPPGGEEPFIKLSLEEQRRKDVSGALSGLLNMDREFA